MKQIRDQVKEEDVSVKENFKHSSQKDAAKGFGGKFGVQTDRKDRVNMRICTCTCNMCTCIYKYM